MDDPLLVRRGEPARDLDRVVDRLAHRNASRRRGATRSVSPSSSSVTMYGAPSCDAEVVHGRDVRVVQDAGGARLLLEALEPIRVLREGRRAGP